MNRKIRRHSAFFLALLLTLSPLCMTAEETADPTTPNPSVINASPDPLLRLLVSKGVVSIEEAKYLGAGTSEAQREKLIFLLKEKGLLNSAEVNDLRSTISSQVNALPVAATSTAVLRPAVYTVEPKVEPKKVEPAVKVEPKPPVPKFVPAVAPLRVLQTEPAKKME
jgi:ABC-type sugar transport system substrate-binding protein